MLTLHTIDSGVCQYVDILIKPTIGVLCLAEATLLSERASSQRRGRGQLRLAVPPVEESAAEGMRGDAAENCYDAGESEPLPFESSDPTEPVEGKLMNGSTAPGQLWIARYDARP
jgi:hypothetical protein